MTTHDVSPDDHPWYLDLRPDPAWMGTDMTAMAALRQLDSIGAVVIAVHADTVPSLADLVAGRCYIGWTFLLPGTVERSAIEAIAATVGQAYRATIAPGHPLPPAAHLRMKPYDAYPSSASLPGAPPPHSTPTKPIADRA